MSGGEKKTESSTSEPWKPAQPVLQTGLDDAQNIYKAGQSFQPYTGSTVTPFSNQTQQGMNDTMTLANGPNPFTGAVGAFSRGAAGDSFNDPQKTALDQFRQTATGGFDPNNNPAFQQVKQQAIDDASGAMNLGASGAGRYGSGIHQGVMAKQIGDLSSRMVGGEYDKWQGRKDAATTSLFNAGSQGVQQQMGYAGGLGAMNDGQYDPAQRKMGVGSMYEDLATRTMNDQLRIWQGQQDAPKRAVEWLNAIGSGAGSMGGTQQAVAQGPGTNPWSAALGGALGLNSILGGGLG